MQRTNTVVSRWLWRLYSVAVATHYSPGVYVPGGDGYITCF